MGNVHMEATQINYRGGIKKMDVEEAIKAAGDEIDSLRSGLTNVETNIASFPENMKKFNILYANTASSAANKVFDLSGRGCGLIFINRNGIGGTVLSIATDINEDVSIAKLSGSDITIDATTSSQTTISLPTWSSIIIMTNNNSWSEVTT